MWDKWSKAWNKHAADEEMVMEDITSCIGLLWLRCEAVTVLTALEMYVPISTLEFTKALRRPRARCAFS